MGSSVAQKSALASTPVRLKISSTQSKGPNRPFAQKLRFSGPKKLLNRYTNTSQPCLFLIPGHAPGAPSGNHNKREMTCGGTRAFPPPTPPFRLHYTLTKKNKSGVESSRITSFAAFSRTIRDDDAGAPTKPHFHGQTSGIPKCLRRVCSLFFLLLYYSQNISTCSSHSVGSMKAKAPG